MKVIGIHYKFDMHNLENSQIFASMNSVNCKFCFIFSCVSSVVNVRPLKCSELLKIMILIMEVAFFFYIFV